MIEIQIAGAGAGKTYGLAKSLMDHIKACANHKRIFALTYTNSATAKIQQEIIKQCGFIPENIYIQTVHSFLLNEIVYPFSSFTIGDVYNRASIMDLPDDVKLKNWHIKKLKEKNIIHTERVYNISRQIVDETVSKHNTKAKRAKVKRLLDILADCFDKIFIDEVQDLDDDALLFFEILGKNGIDIYMIGDPKQAIKHPKSLDFFISNVCSKTYANILPINNITRRVPKEILVISNSFCYKDQQQESLSEVIGELMYIESTDARYDLIISNYIDTKQIVCIDKKTDRYSTSSISKHSFPHEIDDMIRESNHKKDKILFVKAALIDFMNDVAEYGDKKAITNLIFRHSLKLDKHHFAQLYQFCTVCAQKNLHFSVQSIDFVKGLEANTCVIVLSPNLLRYLFINELDAINHFNKEWKRMYVALTRAKQRLVLALDHDLLSDYDITVVKKSIEALGFVYHC